MGLWNHWRTIVLQESLDDYVCKNLWSFGLVGGRTIHSLGCRSPTYRKSLVDSSIFIPPNPACAHRNTEWGWLKSRRCFAFSTEEYSYFGLRPLRIWSWAISDHGRSNIHSSEIVSPMSTAQALLQKKNKMLEEALQLALKAQEKVQHPRIFGGLPGVKA